MKNVFAQKTAKENKRFDFLRNVYGNYGLWYIYFI